MLLVGCTAVQRDTVYSSAGLRLDLYGAENARGVVVVRGGAWAHGDKETFGPLAAELAARGFAVASIEYRTSYPQAVEDVRAAVAWMRERYGQVGILGGSSGGHLALLAGADAVVALAAPTDLVRMHEQSILVDEIGAFLGAPFPEKPELWHLASVPQPDFPVLLIHSRADTVVPYEQSEQIDAERIALPDAPHAFWNHEEWRDLTLDQAATFFRETLNGSLRSSRLSAGFRLRGRPGVLGLRQQPIPRPVAVFSLGR